MDMLWTAVYSEHSQGWVWGCELMKHIMAFHCLRTNGKWLNFKTPEMHFHNQWKDSLFIAVAVKQDVPFDVILTLAVIMARRWETGSKSVAKGNRRSATQVCDRSGLDRSNPTVSIYGSKFIALQGRLATRTTRLSPDPTDCTPRALQSFIKYCCLSQTPVLNFLFA